MLYGDVSQDEAHAHAAVQWLKLLTLSDHVRSFSSLHAVAVRHWVEGVVGAEAGWRCWTSEVLTLLDRHCCDAMHYMGT